MPPAGPSVVPSSRQSRCGLRYKRATGTFALRCGFDFPPSRPPSPLNRPIRGATAPLLDVPPGAARSAAFRRGGGVYVSPPRPRGFFGAGVPRGGGGRGAPGPRSFWTLRVQPPPPPGRVSSNAKKATQRPGPTIYGAWPMKRCQEGARQRPHPSGKARAHAIRARAASSAPPRATIL